MDEERNLDHALKVLWSWVRFAETNYSPNEYVLFGSAVLYLHGIRTADSVGDIDLFVTRRVWGRMFAAEEIFEVQVPRAGDPPFLEAVTNGYRVHVFYEWTPRDAEWITVGECFAAAENVRGWNCVSLAEIRKHKTKAHGANPDSERHAKHARDVELIDAHLARLA